MTGDPPLSLSPIILPNCCPDTCIWAPAPQLDDSGPSIRASACRNRNTAACMWACSLAVPIYLGCGCTVLSLLLLFLTPASPSSILFFRNELMRSLCRLRGDAMSDTLSSIPKHSVPRFWRLTKDIRDGSVRLPATRSRAKHITSRSLTIRAGLPTRHLRAT